MVGSFHEATCCGNNQKWIVANSDDIANKSRVNVSYMHTAL